jgi:glycine hydroxymethyltransferase
MTGLVKGALKSSSVNVNVMFVGVRSVNKAGEKIMYDLESKINQAVFPGLQGGPHNNTIAGIATAFLQAKTPEFRKYQEQV